MIKFEKYIKLVAKAALARRTGKGNAADDPLRTLCKEAYDARRASLTQEKKQYITRESAGPTAIEKY